MLRSIPFVLVGVLASSTFACDDTVDATKLASTSDAASGEGGPPVDGTDASASADAQASTDSSVLDDGGPDGSVIADAGVDANVTPAPCTDAELEAAGANKLDAGTVTITFPNGVNPAQYTPRCVKIKVGQQVAWDGKFENHPLGPFGGDTPNPIPPTSVTPGGGVLTVTFAAAGTFGFRCGSHPAQMNGAVKVVP